MILMRLSVPLLSSRVVALLAVAALLVPVSCAPAETPEPEEPRPSRQYDAATIYDTIAIGPSNFSADGSRILASSDATGIFNVYAYPVDGGEPEMLTDSTTDAFFAGGYFPEDDRLFYSADQGGNELRHLYVREVDGTARDLTPGEEHQAQFGGWSGDSATFWVWTNERDPQFYDLYRYDAVSYDREMVFQNDGGYLPGDVSRDGRWLALSKVTSNADDDIYIVDLVEEGEPDHVTPHTGDVSHGVNGFTPDSSKLYFTSDADSEFTRVWSHDLWSGEQEIVAEADWDVMYITFSWNGRYRTLATNVDGSTKIEVLDTETGEPLELPEVPAGDVASVRYARDGSRIAFAVNGDTAPTNLFVLDRESGDLTRLTNSLSAAVDEADLVASEVIRYPSTDGMEIPALLYKPHQASADNPVPALVSVHGGPGGQSRVGYRADTQLLLNHGYAVLRVNNRGSSGYGKTFFHMDDRQHGEADLADVVAAREYLSGLDWVDGSRVGIIGGSYGGYMVVAALAFEPTAFNVGIDIFGVTNWLRTLENIPPWWGAFKDSLYAEMGDPATDRERLERISALFHAENIVRPLLVVQGANDPRVLQVESDEMVEAVRENGVPVEYIVFDDEGHGFVNKSNRIEAAEAYLRFLDEHLRGEPPMDDGSDAEGEAGTDPEPEAEA